MVSTRFDSEMPLSPLPGSFALNTTRRSAADVIPSAPSVIVCVCELPVITSPVTTLLKATPPDSKVVLLGLVSVRIVLTEPNPVPLKFSGATNTSDACADAPHKAKTAAAASGLILDLTHSILPSCCLASRARPLPGAAEQKQEQFALPLSGSSCSLGSAAFSGISGLMPCSLCSRNFRSGKNVGASSVNG